MKRRTAIAALLLAAAPWAPVKAQAEGAPVPDGASGEAAASANGAEVVHPPKVIRGMSESDQERLIDLTRAVQSENSAESASALSELRSLAAGDPSLELTREVLFLLATWLPVKEGDTDPQAVRALSAATNLYPEDPRTISMLERLGLAQLELGNDVEAHIAFQRWAVEEGDAATPSTLARAAFNASQVGDLVAAFEWSQHIHIEALDETERGLALVAKVIGAHGTGRYDLALGPIEILDETMPETLRIHEDALRAAAEIDASQGNVEGAIERYRVFVNIHSRATDRAEAIWTMSELAANNADTERSQRFKAWLINDHPKSAEAAQARVDLLEGMGQPPDPSLIAAYVVMGRDAPTPKSVTMICDRLAARFIGAGYPIEAISALGRLAREDELESLAPLAARSTLRTYLEPAIGLLESRDDYVGVAAVAAEAENLGVTLPREVAGIVARARARLGLPDNGSGLINDAIAEAQAEAQAGDWAEVVTTLSEILELDRNPTPYYRQKIGRMLAEALWREGQDKEALARTHWALEDEGLHANERRALTVLRADILFSAGTFGEACTAYTNAAQIFTSTWVEQQLGRCAEIQAKGDSSSTASLFGSTWVEQQLGRCAEIQAKGDRSSTAALFGSTLDEQQLGRCLEIEGEDGKEKKA